MIYICLACSKGWTGRNCHIKEKTLEWAAWESWGKCSVSCGHGFRIRNRQCQDVGTGIKFDDKECYGRKTEYGTCPFTECPRWMEWGEWGNCSTYTTCGRGYKVRHRNCSNGGKAGVDRYCKGPSIESAVCEGASCKGLLRLDSSTKFGEGIIALHNDQEDKWVNICGEEWDMGMAEIACKQFGFLGANEVMASEIANDTQTENYILHCTGEENSLQKCMRVKSQNCNTNAGVKCKVKGVWSLWSSWSDCSVTCENGTRIRIRSCSNPPSYNNGEPCTGNHDDYKDCSHPSCPGDGVWFSWSLWSDCSVTCENGTKNRSRECNGPYHGGKPCDGPKEDVAPCFPKMCPVDGIWDMWTEWSGCSVTCGYGTKVRNRTCIGPYHDGIECVGPSRDIASCNTFSCPVDGRWKPWTGWESCSVTCGGGTQNRTRECNLPKHGGQTCTGPSLETKVCNSFYCPVDGFWTTWEQWSACAVSCGYGTKFRNRACYGPFHNGNLCEGESNQTDSCNTFSCPVDGSWKMWSTWEDCSVTCGGGQRNRTRECNLPKHGGHSCQGSALETEDCNTQECPVDGMWKLWSSWDTCSVTCGGGIQNRTRICTDSKHGGQTCTGPSIQSTKCKDFECPVDGLWNVWSNWTTCSLTCGNGTQSRNRTCIGPYYGGLNCSGAENDFRDCNTFHCPVDGYFEPWAEWERCSMTCGTGGTKWRHRHCNPPKHGGAECVGKHNESADCSLYHCPVDCIWLQWSKWGDCSHSCGNGTHSRVRDFTGPFFNGQECTGSPKQERNCNTFDCPVDGYWSEWSEWQACSQSCGRGSKLRNRTCIGPYYEGKECDGNYNETSYCNPSNCPVDGQWNTWESWQSCNVTCSGGIKMRYRQCDGPYHGGKNCTGDDFDSDICEVFPCPVDGVWKSWSVWTNCNVSCGGGSHQRHRTCDGPYYGGANCTGDDVQMKACNIQNCPIDGNFTEWSDWDECNVTCGGGVQWRKRSCYGPFHGGQDCDGNYNESRSCNGQKCPVDGVWKAWSSWDTCNVTCGGGVHWRYRYCDGPYHGGVNCSGNFNQSGACNEHPCPVDGVWEQWTPWQKCNATCGGGYQFRNRNCTQPRYGGLDCQGISSEKQICNTNHCPVDGVFTVWSDWSECNAPCGGGLKWRNRTCDGPHYGGKPCSGEYIDHTDCNTQPCPIDGKWKKWSAWDVCPVTCGGSLINRTRRCDGPFHGGQPCQGNATEQDECGTNPCPIPGEWQDWQAWSRCSVSCDGGERRRERECNMTSYGDLTIPCIGVNTTVESCHTFPCTPYARHCSQLVEFGLLDNVEATIDIDGEGGIEPINVFCDVDDEEGKGVTIIGHDHENRTSISGFEGGKIIILKYDLPEGIVTYVIDHSLACKQYLLWECKGAVIHNPFQTDSWTTFWTNRTSNDNIAPGSQYKSAGYFPGAAKGSGKCACGMTNSCHDPTKVCNCDSNDRNTWLSDGGYLTYKEDLPVVAFLAGDTGDEAIENGYLTIGPVKCWGYST